MNRRTLASIVAAFSIGAAACGLPHLDSLPSTLKPVEILSPQELSRICYTYAWTDEKGALQGERYEEEYFEGFDRISKAQYPSVDWDAIPCIAMHSPYLPGMNSYIMTFEFPVAYELVIANFQNLEQELSRYHLSNPGFAAIFFNPSNGRLPDKTREEKNKSNIELLVLYTQDVNVPLDYQKLWNGLYGILQRLEIPETSQLPTL